MFETIIIAVLTSSIVTGLMVFLFKVYFKKLIEEYFVIRGDESKFQRNIRNKYQETAINSFPEVSELLYRLTVITKHADKHADPRHWNPDIRDLTSEFTDWLFRHRYYIAKNIFELLHECKRTLQDYLVMYDIATRQDPNKPEGFESFVNKFEKRSHRIEEIHNEVLKTLKIIAKGN